MIIYNFDTKSPHNHSFIYKLLIRNHFLSQCHFHYKPQKPPTLLLKNPTSPVIITAISVNCVQSCSWGPSSGPVPGYRRTSLASRVPQTFMARNIQIRVSNGFWLWLVNFSSRSPTMKKFHAEYIQIKVSDRFWLWLVNFGPRSPTMKKLLQFLGTNNMYMYHNKTIPPS